MAKIEVDTSGYYWVTSPWKALMAHLAKKKAERLAREKAKKAAEKAAAAAKAVEETVKVAEIHASTTRVKK